MKKRRKGLLALWIVFALLMSVPPVTVMAEDGWESTRPKERVYVYTGSDELVPGVEMNISRIPSGYLQFDIPFDVQAELVGEDNFMNYVTIPDGYELKEWKVWRFGISGMAGWVSGEPVSVAKSGSISEQEYDALTEYTYSESMTLLMVPIMICKPPIVEITMQDSSNVWQTFSGGVSFQTFYKDEQTIAVSAQDAGSGVKSIQYYLSNTDLFPENRAYTTEEIEGRIPAWNTYSEALSLPADHSYILYIKAVDNEERAAYANTGGIVIDGTAPVISVQDNGTVYFGDTVTFTVSDDYLDTVTVDGSAVTENNGEYTITASKETHVITATDKAGNSDSVTVNAEERKEEEDNNIASGGTFSLIAGRAYRLGAGTWKVAGDDTIYEGGITFYVEESGEFEFQKQ